MSTKSLEDHQKDILEIVRKKNGRIIGKKWKYHNEQKYPYFHILCEKEHNWWIYKYSLLPTKTRPNGSWCPHINCRGKSLKEHQIDIEDIVKDKRGKICFRTTKQKIL